MHPSTHPSTPDFPHWDKNTVHRLAAEYCEFGETLLASQDYIQARSVYQIAIDYSPQLAIAHNGIARAEYHLGNYSAALTAAHRAIAYRAQIDNTLNHDDGNLASSESSSQNLVALQLNEIEFDRLALANFDLYIETHPQDPDGYYYRGLYYERLEHDLLALADFDRAISLAPKTALFYHARGCVRQHLGNFAAALADYDLVIRLQPTFAAVYDNRGEIRRLSGDLSHALDDYNLAIELNPLFVAAYFHRAIAHAELGKIDDALVDYNRTISLDPKYVDAYVRRSWIYFRQGKYSQAVCDCKAIAQIAELATPAAQPECFQADYLLGVIHSLSGFPYQAIADFTRSIEIAPNYLAARYYRGVIYRELGNIAKSDDDFARAKSIQDSRLERKLDLDETRLYAEGLALYYSGRSQAARTMLNLADLHAKQSANQQIHLLIATFIARHY
jgi:tetratricopeptide (TPR) repeat protein